MKSRVILNIIYFQEKPPELLYFNVLDCVFLYYYINSYPRKNRMRLFAPFKKIVISAPLPESLTFVIMCKYKIAHSISYARILKFFKTKLRLKAIFFSERLYHFLVVDHDILGTVDWIAMKLERQLPLKPWTPTIKRF